MLFDFFKSTTLLAIGQVDRVKYSIVKSNNQLLFLNKVSRGLAPTPILQLMPITQDNQRSGKYIINSQHLKENWCKVFLA